jgi:hypothetical protein
MSLPAMNMGAAIGGVAVSPLDALLQVFNQNPYFIGLMMLLLNLGGRFISLEVTKQQEQFLQLPWVRRLLIFTVLFVATRNLWVAFWMTLIVVLCLGYLFNENSALCLFGSGGAAGASCEEKGEMTPEEREILQRLSSKAARYTQGTQGGSSGNSDSSDSDKEVGVEDVYRANMRLMGA